MRQPFGRVAWVLLRTSMERVLTEAAEDFRILVMKGNEW